MYTSFVIASAVLSGLVGGVFHAFSTFVMRALADQPAPAGIAAMQRINVTVINPFFLGPFFAVALLLAVPAWMAWAAGQTQSFGWLAAALAVYVAGSIGVTMGFNVPRNNQLAALPATSGAAAAYWPTYVRQWTLWNHVRTIACLATSVFGAIALVADAG